MDGLIRPAADRFGPTTQVATVALPIARAILQKAVQGGDKVDERVLSADDGAVQLYCAGETPRDDATLLLLPGAETFDALAELDEAVGPRNLILLNPQFSTPADLGLFKRNAASTKRFFGEATSLRDKFATTYCAQELSCRSEDLRLVHEYGKGWRAYFRRVDMPQTTRGDAAGRDAESPRRRLAATPRPCDVDIPRRRLAAPPRPCVVDIPR